MQERALIFREGKATASQALPSLPVQFTSFVGREQEITRVCELLRRPEIRLLTLIGTGGVGKTRLGLQVVTRLSKDFADHVCFIPLMDVRDPELVIPTIAKALGLQEQGSRPLLEHVQAFLKQKRLLLLLDTFEQVIEAAPTLLHLLVSCCGLKILVTSRTVLRISGEQLFLVPPLALPELELLPKKEELLQYPAITLFLDRTRTILPEFLLTEENSRCIAEICLHLDGLPLAIELAVPHLQVLSPKTFLERLDQRFQLVTQGMRDAPGRQQTLQKTQEWSYRLLSRSEQHLFRVLSIFVGGCTLQALETIWELAECLPAKELILEGVVALLDKSMLTRSMQGDEEPRLLLLRTLREYGWQCLTLTGELQQLQWAHATYYLALAEQAEPELKGAHPCPWLEHLQREHENVREAFCFLMAQSENEARAGTEMALRLATALERFWIIGGHVKEGHDLLERTLKRSHRVSSSIRGHALCLLATLARYQGDFHDAAAACEESLSIFRELGDPAGIAGSLYRLGYIAWRQGNADAARTSYEESLAIAQGERCQEVRSETLSCFASLAFFQPDASLARLLIEESLDLSRALHDQYTIASALNILGWVSLLQEDFMGARTLQEESLAICRALGNQRGMAHPLGALGEIASRMGDFAQACECYEESLAIVIRIDIRWIASVYLEGLARAALAQGEVIWAVYLLSAAQALRQILGASMTPLEGAQQEQALATLHDVLEEHVFAAAWAQGQTMSPEQAVAARSLCPQAPSLSLFERQPVLNRLPVGWLHDDLTQRQREVLSLIAQGLTDAQVAKRLCISPRTVNCHLTAIYRTLQVSSRSAATRYALEHTRSDMPVLSTTAALNQEQL